MGNGIIDDPDEQEWRIEKWGLKIQNFLKNLEEKPMTVHNLKIDPEFYEMAIAGQLPFQLRKSDRDFKIGDVLKLKETTMASSEMASGGRVEYTGNMFSFVVKFKIDRAMPGLEKGYCILG